MQAVQSASHGRYGYLGSWHTHPRTTPTPSSVDIATAKAMAEQDDLRLPAPLMLILSTTGTSRHVQAETLRGRRWDPVGKHLRLVPVEDCELAERHCRRSQCSSPHDCGPATGGAWTAVATDSSA
jgi:hypothetical protein